MLAVTVVAGGVALDKLTPREPHFTPSSDQPDVCFALSVIRETVLRDRVPSPFATPEEVAATMNVNRDLAQVRRTLFELNGIRQLNCPPGSTDR